MTFKLFAYGRQKNTQASCWLDMEVAKNVLMGVV